MACTADDRASTNVADSETESKPTKDRDSDAGQDTTDKKDKREQPAERKDRF